MMQEYNFIKLISELLNKRHNEVYMTGNVPK